MRKRARVLGWIAIAGIGPALLLGAEACARIFDITPAFGRSAEIPAWLDRNILVKESRWMELLAEAPGDLRNYYRTYEWDRRLFYRLRPDVRVSLTDVMAPPGIRERTRWTLVTNAKGFPGPVVPYGPHPGTFRIVCLGDSSTFGWGVESGEVYPAVLREELHRRFPGRAIEVVNLGVCGYSSFQGRILMDREARRYKPDVVTLSYGSNDWSRVPEPFDVAYERNAGWSGALREFLHHSRAYEAYAGLLTSFTGGSEDASETPGGMPLNVGPRKSLENQVAMIDEARAWGATPILVSNCVVGEMAEPIREAASRTGTPLLDTENLLKSQIQPLASGRLLPEMRARTLGIWGPAMLAKYPSLEVYMADRCHPNVVGQRLIGRALADMVAPLVTRQGAGNP